MKKLSTKKIILITALLFSLILISFFTYKYFSFSKQINRVEINREEVLNTGNELPKEAEKLISIALLGSDFNPNFKLSATDATMVLSIDTELNKIKLFSLMRDMYLDVPGQDKCNLNYTILNGGIENTLKTINYNFNLNVDKYVQVDLSRLPKLIDVLGGVEIEITDEELKMINEIVPSIDKENKTTTAKLTASGKQLLNGTQASAYSRIRYTSGRDFKRTERQRTVLNCLFNKFKDINISEASTLLKDILPLLTTNLSDSEMLSILTKCIKMKPSNIEQNRFPLDKDIIKIEWTDMYHMIVDVDSTKNEIHKFIYSK